MFPGYPLEMPTDHDDDHDDDNELMLMIVVIVVLNVRNGMSGTGRIRNPNLMASAGDVRVVCVFRLSMPRTQPTDMCPSCGIVLE